MTLAERLVEARKRCGLTQSAVAQQLDVSAQAVSSWERGETMPDIMKLPELAGMYGVSVDWLLDGAEVAADIAEVTARLSDRLFDEERMYTYVKTYATLRGMTQTLRVLPLVRQLHRNQVRKGKDRIPYIYHPLLVCCHGLALGLDEDDLIAAALLHDICEDCGVTPEELPVNEVVREAVRCLTKKLEVVEAHAKGQGFRKGSDPAGGGSLIMNEDFEKCGDWTEEDMQEAGYYQRIAGNRIATMVKLLDRCNNISGMATGFSDEKMAGYIKETERWIYPLFRTAKVFYPEYSNQIFLIKYHMTSVVETIRHHLR